MGRLNSNYLSKHFDSETKNQVQAQPNIVIQTPENGKQLTPIQPHDPNSLVEDHIVHQSKTNPSNTRFKRRVQNF